LKDLHQKPLDFNYTKSHFKQTSVKISTFLKHSVSKSSTLEQKLNYFSKIQKNA